MSFGGREGGRGKGEDVESPGVKAGARWWVLA